MLALLFLVGAAQAADFVPNEVLVKYRDGADRSLSKMNALYDSAGVTKVKRIKGMMGGFEQLVLENKTTVKEAIAALRLDPAVEYAQPNYILRAFPTERPVVAAPRVAVPCIFPGIPFPPGCDDSAQPTPTDPAVQDPPAEVSPPVADPSLSRAYGLAKVGAVEAWQDHPGSRDMIVAVIDTGIDYNHEDLSFNVWRNPKPGPKNDLTGYDFVHDDGMPFDDHKHGTHCAGTIGAVGGNGKGVSGVSQRVSIMGIKFLSAQGEGDTAGAIKAIEYAVSRGAKVLSNSWGGEADENNDALEEAIERAGAADVLVIAAAGNSTVDNDGARASYPAAFDSENIIAVAATDKNDRLASFSNYGLKSTDLAAPGVGVYSLVPGNSYTTLSGTSMACPHVAGAAALLWSRHPEWKHLQVKEALLASVDPLPSLAGKTVTGGRLNVLKALRSTE